MGKCYIIIVLIISNPEPWPNSIKLLSTIVAKLNKIVLTKALTFPLEGAQNVPLVRGN